LAKRVIRLFFRAFGGVKSGTQLPFVQLESLRSSLTPIQLAQIERRYSIGYPIKEIKKTPSWLSKDGVYIGFIYQVLLV
jgi:hypothetical protein